MLLATHPLSSIPVLHSQPDAPAKLYLDFDGEPATTWFFQQVPATPAFSTDGDTSTFSDAELAAIVEIWQRVAEVYSPFRIDVTTERPPEPWDRAALQVVIGGNGAWTGGGYGGIAQIGGFADTFLPNTVYVFEDNLGTSTAAIAGAAAHEAGHGFGLEHQSLYSGSTLVQAYHPGDGVTVPVMGAAHNGRRPAWRYGQTTSATTYQDDLAILTGWTNGFGYRPDEHGDSAATATALEVAGSSISGSGVIAKSTDADFFSFTTGAGAIVINGNVAPYGAMLDLKLELYDSGGGLVAAADTATLGETISITVPAGTYYVAVKSHGGYGDIGQYTITGTIVPPDGPPPSLPVAEAGGPYTVAEGASVTLSAAASTGTGLTYVWDLDGDGIFGETGAGATRGNETGASVTFSAAGLDGPASRTVTLRVTDSLGAVATDTATITLTNAPPVVTLGGAATVNEGATYTLTFSATDPGVDDALAGWTINWGDGTTQQVAAGATSATHVYANDGSFTIVATATDDDGGTASASKAVTVANVAPTVTANGSAAVDRGATYTLSLSATDPGSNDSITWLIAWGDGQTTTASGRTASATHVYTSTGNYQVTATATDSGNATGQATVGVSVLPVSLSVSLTAPASIAEGGTASISFSASGNDVLTGWLIDWGDGQTSSLAAAATGASHAYGDDGSYTVTATALGALGNYAASKVLGVTNVAPTASATGAASVAEGSAYSLTLSATDPGAGDAITWQIDWGDGQTSTVAGRATSAMHTYADNGTYVIKATARDDAAATGTASRTVTVTNVAPTLTIHGATTVQQGQAYALSLSRSDPGADTVTSWAIQWGDGTTQVVGGSPASVTHVYAEPGTYVITATATDEDGTYAASNSVSLAVTPLAPRVSIAGGPASVEGSTYVLSLSSSGSGSGGISSWTIDWGDGRTSTLVGNPSSASHVYVAPGSFRITASATDEDGTHAAPAGVDVAVASLPPSVTAAQLADIDTAGVAAHTFNVTYADITGIDPTSLGDDDIVVTGPDGVARYATLLGTSAGSGAVGSLSAIYRLAAPAGGAWTPGHNGTYVVRLLAGSVMDGSGHAAEAAEIGSFEVRVPDADTEPPVATLTLAPAGRSVTTRYYVTLTFTDNAGIDLSSINNQDMSITGPRAYEQAGRVLSIASSSDGRTATVVYAVTGPGGNWDFRDNGTYTIWLRSRQVLDTSRNAAVAGALGTFNVRLSQPPETTLRLPALTVGDSTTYRGYLTSTDRQDRYRVDLKGTTRLALTLSSGAANVYFDVTRADGTVVATRMTSFDALFSKGTYFIRVHTTTSSAKAYVFLVENRPYTSVFSTALIRV